MKTLKIIGVILLASLAIDYWQWVLAVAVIAGACYIWRAARVARIARRAACVAQIAALEGELGI